MSTNNRGPARITVGRDAVEFAERVEWNAALDGVERPRLHHWVAAACARPFLAKSLAREKDVLATRQLMRRCLDEKSYGPELDTPAVMLGAREICVERGETEVRTWHLVKFVFGRFGMRMRDPEPGTEAVGEEKEASGTPGVGEGAAETEEERTARRNAAIDREIEEAMAGISDEELEAIAANALLENGLPRPDWMDDMDDVDGVPGADGDAPARTPLLPTPRPKPPRRRSEAEPGRGAPGPETGAARGRPVRKGARPATPMLDECGTDWTALAREGKLPPMVGREAEMALLLEGLCRPTKPNALLVGEPGVGKSALIEGLAARIAKGDVPAPLRGRQLFALDMAGLTRDSRFYGVMEQRLGRLLDEAREVHAILFLDEGHVMMGSGGREGTGDIASVLKPALARGELSFITATTEDEYRRFIVPNGALERRFNVVRVAEPDRPAVRRILAAHRDAIAQGHGVTVPDEALDRLVEITAARLAHRREPDRSRDLLDQAVARAIAGGRTQVTTDELEATARQVAGSPEVTETALDALRADLVHGGLVGEPEALALVERLGVTFAGLALHPQRPRAVVAVMGGDAPAVADAIAQRIYGAPERVIGIDIGGLRDPSSVSGFLGATAGYIGHGTTLPIHGLAERPSSVLLLRGVDGAHEAIRDLLARAIRDGHLTDAQARRIGLTQAVVVLETQAPAGEVKARIGFRAGAAGGNEAGVSGPKAAARPKVTADPKAAAALLGQGLVGECDVVVERPAGDAPGAADPEGQGWPARALGRLAAAYRASGVELAWDAEVERALGADLREAPPAERERQVESRVGRAVRPHLATGRRPLRARLRTHQGALGVEVTT